jgi:hypothetical protein
VFRWVRVVLATRREGSIAGSRILIPILIFVVFEKVWMDFPYVYDFHIRRGVPKLERGNFDRSDERRTRD